MADFRVKKSEFQAALQQGATAQASVCMARTRTAGVNKKFQFSALGAWAIAEAATAGNLEIELRMFEDGLKGFVTTLQDAGSEISGTLTVARDDVFSAVGASAQDGDTITCKSGTSARSSCDSADYDMGSLGLTASSISADCDGLENSGGITGALFDLQSKVSDKRGKINDLGQKIDGFENAVRTFESNYVGRLDASKFVTEDMRAAAIRATQANVGAGSWNRIAKNVTTVTKNYLSLIGECLKGDKTFEWVKGKGGWRASLKSRLRTKLSEGTAGLIVRDVDEFGHKRPFLTGRGKHAVKSQLRLNKEDIVNGFRRNGDDVVEAVGKDCGKILKLGKLDTVMGFDKVKLGKGLKAIGRNLGYVGDALDVIDTFGKAGTAFNKSGGGLQGAAAATGQVAKGVAKIGVGKLLGAGIGAVFGGPVGAVAGMAIGSVLTSWTDELIDWGFSQFGVERI